MEPVNARLWYHVCGAIRYDRDHMSIGSDICIEYDDDTSRVSDDYRKFLHDSLDEFLDQAPAAQQGGIFFLGNRRGFL